MSFFEFISTYWPRLLSGTGITVAQFFLSAFFAVLLSLIFGLLAGTLNGAAFGKDVVDFNADPKATTNTGHFVIALDIAAFADVETFKRQVDGIWDEMKSSALLPGVQDIRLPGERLAATSAERRANGIPIPQALGDRLDGLADELGIDRL